MEFLLIIAVFALFFWFLFARDEKATRNPPSKTTLDLNIDWDKVDDEFVIFDLETTGLKSNKVAVDIVEIGALKVKKEDLRNGIDATAFQALLIPHRGGLNPEAVRINGITQPMIDKDGEAAEKVMNEFVEFVGNRKLIAYNVDFDRWFLKRELAHWGIKKNFKYECAYELSKDAFSNLTNYRLATVAKSLGIQNPHSHRSLGDCVTTLWVYLAAKSKL